MMYKMTMIAAAFLAVGCASVMAAIAGDEVKALPGWTAALPSKQYSGLMTLNAKTGKALHYWFVESEGNPATDPVVLWMNGGPGCSSLDGYLYEQGPFHVDESDHTKLYYNENTWAKQANMIFLEAPAGVGFSYSETPSDYRTNDTQTANDNYNFLLKFFAGFPEYANNEFYITGESYAGVYVPTLAARVMEGNNAGGAKVNLKGVAVGNGCTGNDVYTCGGQGLSYEMQLLTGYALVSPTLDAELATECGDYSNPSLKCDALVQEAHAAIGDIDIYDVLGKCISGGMGSSKNPNTRRRVPLSKNLGGPDECIDGIAAAAWLNTKEVQDAINVSPAMPYVKEWTVCSDKIDYTSTASNLPKNVYPNLVSNIRVLIYNGAADACVPWTDNFAWTKEMGYDVAKSWHPWSLDNQVAGYAQSYTVPGAKDPFTFITVRAAGHMVPQYQPEYASEMFRRFIGGEAF